LARLKSDDKRNAILEAAARVFAERGLSAATSAISSAAGIAEGTLFTYFKTKDELVNALYREIKLELADAMMSGYPRRQSVRSRLKHVWDSYVDWGLANPVQYAVLRLVQVWGGLTEDSKRAGMVPFVEVAQMMEEAMSTGMVKDLPRVFFEAAMSALAEMTLDLVRLDPKEAEAYRMAGFAMLWGGVVKKV